MTVKIMLDPGHGYGREYNRGSLIGNEGDNNWAYSLVLKKALEARGFVVGLTRSEKSDPSLEARGRAAAGYDLLISVHSNAAGADVRGTEIWNDVNDGFSGASGLCAAIARAFGHRNRGVKLRRNDSGGNWYGVLRANRAKAGMLIEHGFHTNRLDCSYYVNHREELANVTADYLAEYYKLKKPTHGKGDNTMNGYLICFKNDGDALNAMALMNAMFGLDVELRKGDPKAGETRFIIQVGGASIAGANKVLSGKDRREVLTSIGEYVKTL